MEDFGETPSAHSADFAPTASAPSGLGVRVVLPEPNVFVARGSRFVTLVPALVVLLGVSERAVRERLRAATAGTVAAFAKTNQRRTGRLSVYEEDDTLRRTRRSRPPGLANGCLRESERQTAGKRDGRDGACRWLSRDVVA